MLTGPFAVRLCGVYSDGHVIFISKTRLRSLDLTSLVQVGGGNIIITGNRNMCYVGSVNWTALRIGDKSGHTVVRNNRNRNACG